MQHRWSSLVWYLGGVPMEAKTEIFTCLLSSKSCTFLAAGQMESRVAKEKWHSEGRR